MNAKSKTMKMMAVFISFVMVVTMVPTQALASISTRQSEENVAYAANETDGTQDVVSESEGQSTPSGGKARFSTTDSSSVTINSVSYWDHSWNGSEVVAEEKTHNATVVPDNGAMTSGWYYLANNVTKDGRISISGDTHLILGDGKTLNVKGFYVPKGATLTIYAQSGGTGRIYSKPSGGAAIGAYADHKGGNIVIHGGRIEAYGHDHCAGIGSNDDDRSDVGSITIYDGYITAEGGGSGAGIGGGRASEGGNITIYGGTVNAKGGHYGAGIGGGNGQDTNPIRGAHGGKITIWGGNVTAKGGDDGAGIGGGEGGNAGTIVINGGTVNATGGNNSAGIGTGEGESTGIGGSVTINGGNVTAWGGGDAAGIGGGEDANCDTVTINDGTVKAYGGSNGAGIGAGRNANGGHIVITGGDVTAEGKDSSAGIGGADPSGSFADHTSIEISGGTIHATGNSKGAGIGGGEYGHATIHISGGNITAKGGSSGGAGIGNGKDGSGSAILLDYTDETAEDISITTGSYKGTVTLQKPFKNGGETFRETSSVSDLGKLASNPPLVAWTDAEPIATEVEVGSWAALQAAINDELTNEKKITLTGSISPESGDTRIEIPNGKNITIDLNGFTMDRQLTNASVNSNGSVIHVAKGGTLTIIDSSSAGTGTITGGHSTKGGGILNEGTVNLKGGTISGNKASMSGGSNGTGGGIYNAGTLTVSGGSISSNTAATWGGGIYLADDTGSTLNLNGGQITNNTCGNNGGGVHVSSTAYINASGSPVVKDNKKGSEANNVNLADGTFIRITGALKPQAQIHMHMSYPTSGNITSGLKGKGAAANFVSDDAAYEVRLDANGEAYLYKEATITVDSWTALQNAVNAARDGDIIQLAGPNNEVKRTGSQSRIQVRGKRITIDLAGNKLDRNLTSKYDDGQVIEVFDGATLTIRDSVGGGTITGGYAKQGGGIYINEGATCVITGGTVTGNTATDDGGGIYVKGTLKMSGGAITNNKAEDNGGGMFVEESGRIDLAGADISYNTAEDDGGGIKIYSEGDARITGCTITYNKTNDKYGGGILMDMSGKTMTITDTKIDHNDADDDGGGIYLRKGTIVMNGGSISENRSYRDGGGIRVIEKTAFTATNVTFNKNTADTEEGGGIKNLGTTTLTNCIITNNKAGKEGGGIYNDDVKGTTGVLKLYDCTIFGNSTQKHGGGIYSSNKVTLIGGSITGNTANDSGGGMMAASDAATYIGGGLVVKDNGAVVRGKDIYLVSGKLNVVEKLIEGAEIGVTLKDNTADIFTSDYPRHNSADEPSDFFFSPEGYGVEKAGDGEAKLSSGWKQLRERIANMANGETIVIDKNYTASNKDDALEIPKGRSITIDLNGYTLNRNRSTQDGDGHVIWVRDDANLTLIDSTATEDEPGTGTITGGYSKRGGGIYVGEDATLTAKGINITGNKADDDGGGIYMKSGGKLTMENCVVTKNDADDNGGGIFSNEGAGTIIIKNTMISDNYASNDGGGMKLWLGADSSITNCEIVRNFSDDRGGGIYIEAKDSTLTIRNTTIDNNSSGDDGAGILLQTGKIVMSDSSISSNTTNNDSGGIKVTNKTEFHATDVEICNNTAKKEEAGALKNYGTTTLTRCTISGNTAGKDGGAIFNDKDGSGSKGDLTIEDCRIFGNSTAGNGGGIWNDYKLTLKGNNLIGAASAEEGEEALPGNSAQNQGGGIYIGGDADFTKISGTLSMTGNSAGLGNDLYVRGYEVLTLTGSIAGTEIGMIDMEKPGVFTKDYSKYHSGTDPSGFFGTDPKAIPVEWNDNRTEAQLRSNWPDLQALIDAAADKRSMADKGHPETADGRVVLDTNYTAGANDVNLLVRSGKTVTIDLNGHTINRNLTKESVIDSSEEEDLSLYDRRPELLGKKDLGHVLKVEKGGTLTLQDSSAEEGTLGAGLITGGYARFGGGIFISEDATVNMEGGTIYGNTASYSGSAFYVNGTLNMTGGALLANHADKNGGGICGTENSTLSIANAFIQSNSANVDGGALYMHSGANLKSVTGSRITDNTASENGGALVFLSEGKTITITDTVIDNNSSGDEGGAIYLYRGTIKMTGGSLSGNDAKNDGGGAMVTSKTTFEATNVDISNNTARNGQGGGIKNYGTAKLANCSITGNSSAEQGGGVFNDNDGSSAGKMTLENCTIQGNSSRSNGGGVYSDKKLNFIGGTITGNTSTEKGGGVFIGGDSETTGIEGALVIKDNTASVFADDLYLRTGRKLELTGKLTDAADIHTELQTGTGVVTKGYRSKHGSWAPETYFTFTKGYDVRFTSEGEVELVSGWNALKKKIESAESGAVIIIDKDYTAADSDDRIKIDGNKNITIDLNGYTLNRRRQDKVNDGHVLEVFGGSTLTIKDNSESQAGTITGAWSYEGGIFVNSNATLNLQGGTITGNRADSNGGGIYANGTVTMTGGRVEANKTSGSGGGIYMVGGSTLNLEGGTVTGNEAGDKGGGIMINDGTTVRVKGSPVAEKNRSTGAGLDIYIPQNAMLNINGALSEGAKLGVDKPGNGKFTSGYSSFNDGVDPAKYFVSTQGYGVYLEGNEAVIGFQVYGSTEYTDPFINWNEQVGSQDALNSQNWMSGISGERYLNEINMPGSHDSGMNSIDNKKVSQVWTWAVAALSLIATGIVAATAGAGIGLIISAGIFGASALTSLALPNDWTSFAAFGVEAISAPMAKTQKEYIDQQLNEGARQLDIRLYHKHKEYKFIGKDNFNGWQFYDDGNNLWVCHGKKAGGRYQAQDPDENQLSFDQTLIWVMDFLEKHPTETIILDLRPETEDAGEARKIYERTRTILEALAMRINPSTGEPFLYKEPGSDDYFAPYTHMPKLSDSRGKIVLMPDNDTYVSYVGGFKQGDFVSESLDELNYQNSRSSMINQVQVEYGKANGDGSVLLPRDASQNIDRLWYWELNCTEQEAGTKYYIGMVDAPHILAEEVNAALIGEGKTFGPERTGQYIGWVRLDSFRADYAETIWRTNFSDDFEYFTVTVKSGLDDPNYPDQTYRLLKGTEIAIPGNIYKQVEGSLYFDRWTTDEGISFAPGESYTVNEDVTFTATWLEEGKVPVQVIWKDGDDADDLRPNEVPLTITAASGTTPVNLTLTQDQDWRQIIDLTGDAKDISTTWEGVVPTEDYPKGQDAEGQYAYTWSHEGGTGYTVTFTHTPQRKMSVYGDITWLDDDDVAGMRPGSVTIDLLKDNERIDSQVVTPDEKDSWSFDFGERDMYENGEAVDYRVVERLGEEASSIYAVRIDGFNITNIYEPDMQETATVMGTVTWDDANNAKELRPQSIDISLMADGEEVDSQTVPADQGSVVLWVFEELPLKNAAGEQIHYTVVAEDVEGYTVTCIPLDPEAAEGISEYGSMSLGEETYLFQVVYTLVVPDEEKTPAEVSQEPQARELTYSGQPQKLIDKGSASGGTLLYALGDSANTPPDASAFTMEVPEGTDAGTYHVWYYVYGDALHTSTDPTCIDAEIGKAQQNIEVEDVNATAGDVGRMVEAYVIGVGDTREGLGALSFAVTEHDDVVDVDSTTGELTLKKGGTAKVTVTAAETDNYLPATAEVTITVAPGKHTLTFYEDMEGTVVRKVVETYDGMSLTDYADYGMPGNDEMVKAGYTFAGWVTEPNIVVNAYTNRRGELYPALVGKIFDFSQEVEGDLNAYPLWIRDRLDVTIDTGAPEGEVTIDAAQALNFIVNIDEKIVMRHLVAAERAGYELAGWYTQGGVLWNGDDWKTLDYVETGWTETAGWGMTPEYCNRDENGDIIKEVNLPRRYNYYTVTLTARWNPLHVGVEYVVGNDGTGEVADDKTYVLGDVITLADAPQAKVGKTFTGWKIDGDDNLYSAGGQFTFKDWNLVQDGKLTFTAQYVDTPRLAVTFDSAGGTAVEPIEVYEGMTIDEEPSTTRDGYTFQGWFDEGKDPASRVEFPYEPSGDVELTAHWKANEYTITFDSAGGTPVDAITAPYESAITPPSDPSKEHYDFDGWSPALPETMPLGGLETMATWKPTVYSITFDAGDGREPARVEGIYGSAVEEPEEPVRDGYVFAGWLDEQGNYVDFPTYMPDTNPTYTAKWKAVQEPPVVTAQATDPYTVKATATPEGAEFIIVPAGQEPTAEDWADAKTAEDGQVTFDGLQPNTTYDVWARMPETDEKAQSEPAKAEVTTLKEKAEVTAAPQAREGLVYTAQPQALVTEGSAEGGTIEYAIGPDGVMPPAEGWSTNVPAATDAGDYHVWWRVVGDETHEGLEPACVDTAIAKADQTIETEENIAGEVNETGRAIEATVAGVNGSDEGVGSLRYTVTEGSEYVGVDDETGALFFKAPGTAKITVTADATPNYNEATKEVTVTIAPEKRAGVIYVVGEDGTGDIVDDATYALGEVITLAGAPQAKVGKTFTGWKIDGDENLYSAGGQFTFKDWNLVQDGKLTFIAQYVDTPEFAVTFNSAGGTAVAPIEVYEGMTIDEEPATTRDGYTFQGWFDEVGDSDNKVEFPYEPTGNVELTAHWKANEYTITFNSAGGTPVDAITAPYESAITAPADPTREHYDFDGWNPALPEKMPLGGLETMAIWKPTIYSITFNAGDGTEPFKAEGIYGSVVDAPDDPARDDAVFAGWLDEQGTPVDFPLSMPDTNPTYTAKWKVIQAAPEVSAEATDPYTVKASATPEGAEFIIVPAGTEPTAGDWADAKTAEDGQVTFDGLQPNTAYEVWARMPETDDAAQSDAAKAEVTTLKEKASVTAAPQAREGLVYTAQPQALVTEGSAVGGVIEYAIGTDASTSPEDGWSTDVPKATDAGDHYVWWRVVGDENHEGLEPACVDAAIAKADQVIEVDESIAAEVGDPDQPLAASVVGVDDADENVGILSYEVTEGTDVVNVDPATGVLTFKAPGTAKVKVTAAATDNYNEATKEVTVTVAPQKRAGVEYVVGEDGTGDIADDATYALGDVITLGGAPQANVGKTFTGWKIDGDDNLYSAGGQFTFEDWSLVQDDKLTFTAQYVDTPRVAVTFNSAGGTAVAPIEVYKGLKIEEEPATTRDGYSFLGWFDEASDQDNRVEFPFEPTGNVELTAHWKANEYTITFDSAGGTPVESITADYGAPITAPDNPTKPHYTFDGWYPTLPEKMPLGGLKVVATWKPMTYHITFDAGNGSEPAKVEGIYGSVVDAPEDPVRDGYVFSGWLDENNKPASFPFYMPDTNPSYTAKWKAVQEAPEINAEATDPYTVKASATPEGAEFIIVPAGTEPTAKDWADAKTAEDGQVTFNNLDPNTTYDVWARMPETDEAIESQASKKQVTTPKLTPEAIAPTANSDLVYTGADQALVADGQAVGGRIEYAIGPDGVTPPVDGWSTETPKAANAGDYHVWWRVVGDKDYEDLAPTCIDTSIAKADQNVATADTIEGTVGESDKAVVALATGVNGSTADVGALSFEVTEGTDVVSVDPVTGALTFKAAGSATIKVTAAATGNYNEASSVVMVTVSENEIPDPPDDTDISYRNTAGDGLIWTKGSNVTADFTFNRSVDDDTTYNHFMGISVDGAPVDGANYTAEPGSVIVQLLPDYLETLALGGHAVTAHFDDANSASANFTVVEEEIVPPIGGNYYPVTWDPNGGTWNDSVYPFETGSKSFLQPAYKGGEIEVLAAPIRDGYTFLYWECDGKHYNPGQMYTVEKQYRVFTAKWEKKDTTPSGPNDDDGDNTTPGDSRDGNEDRAKPSDNTNGNNQNSSVARTPSGGTNVTAGKTSPAAKGAASQVKTGDDAQLTLWILLMFLAAATVFIARRRIRLFGARVLVQPNEESRSSDKE